MLYTGAVRAKKSLSTFFQISCAGLDSVVKLLYKIK